MAKIIDKPPFKEWFDEMPDHVKEELSRRPQQDQLRYRNLWFHAKEANLPYNFYKDHNALNQKFSRMEVLTPTEFERWSWYTDALNNVPREYVEEYNLPFETKTMRQFPYDAIDWTEIAPNTTRGIKLFTPRGENTETPSNEKQSMLDETWGKPKGYRLG